MPMTVKVILFYFFFYFCICAYLYVGNRTLRTFCSDLKGIYSQNVPFVVQKLTGLL